MSAIRNLVVVSDYQIILRVQLMQVEEIVFLDLPSEIQKNLKEF